MSYGLPRWFRLLFTCVMLTLCVVFVTGIIYQQQCNEELAEIEANIEHTSSRIPRQAKELAQYREELPAMLAELEPAEPAALAAQEQADVLKAQRNALRKEVATQEAQIQALDEQLAALPDPDETLATLENAINLLDQALNDVN